MNKSVEGLKSRLMIVKGTKLIKIATFKLILIRYQILTFLIIINKTQIEYRPLNYFRFRPIKSVFNKTNLVPRIKMKTVLYVWIFQIQMPLKDHTMTPIAVQPSLSYNLKLKNISVKRKANKIIIKCRAPLRARKVITFHQIARVVDQEGGEQRGWIYKKHNNNNNQKRRESITLTNWTTGMLWN